METSETIPFLRHLVEKTYQPAVLGTIGDFAARVASPGQEHVLVASTDGVGTKTKLASLLGRHEGIGADLVHHCINDVLAMGARPLFLLDYIGHGQLPDGVLERVLASVAAACRAHGVSLVGGETSTMPDMYAYGEYDLVGTLIGSAPRHQIVDRSLVRPGDQVIGLPSSGLHTNGYTRVRDLYSEAALGSWVVPLNAMLGAALLEPHHCYLPAVGPLLPRRLIKSMAHITGGGLPANLPRALPAGLGAVLDKKTWRPPPLFAEIAQDGRLEPEEMYSVFNMGIGFCLIVSPREVDGLLRALPDATVIGHVVPAGAGPRVRGLF